ncbi:hypothetical protein [Archaeoglobus fulgidus]|nr:hypothetical protein [Archaeoglobus fulgidus]AIG98637.1 hypothetical protein AFULGI_00018840 [Archaeoglobus fulgidus DSM 8774]KUJ93024.1 MAG: hypothetical protein XD40_1792 [Archaeoglobus fulgidus]KUK05444.1 MAG: Uncharacterized protein XD48_2317 [Archaeoglobus fulgidus]
MLKKGLEKTLKFFPRLEDLAEVFDPLHRGEAFASSPNPRSIERKYILNVPTLKAKSSVEKITDGQSYEILGQPTGFEISEVKTAEGEIKIRIDFVNNIFADVMKIMCNVGLVLMMVFAAFYFAGINPADNLNLEVQKWSEPAEKFWSDVKGIHSTGYSWFLQNPLDPENAILLSVTLLALTPVIGILLTIPRSTGALRVIFLVIAVEFVYAIFRVMMGGGPMGH